MTIIKLNLKHLLEKTGKTKRQVADETGLNIRTLDALAAGKKDGFRLTTIGLLCDAFNCEPGDLIVKAPAVDHGS